MAHSGQKRFKPQFRLDYDVVDIGLLLFKLEKYDVSGPLLQWLGSYISGRSQRIKFGTAISDSIVVRSGVPQGGVLDPLIIKVYINDTPKLYQHLHIDI